MATYFSGSFSSVDEEMFDEIHQSAIKKNIFKEYKNEFLKILGSNYGKYVEIVPEAHLDIVKKYFEKEVQSPRRLSYANTLSDIIVLLIKLDILNEEDMTPLATIASLLENSQLQTLARSYEKKIQTVSNVAVCNKNNHNVPIKNDVEQSDLIPTSNQILPNNSFVLNQNANPLYNYQIPSQFQNQNLLCHQQFSSLHSHQSVPMAFGALPFNLPIVIPPQNYTPNHSLSATLPNVLNPQSIPQLPNNYCQFYPSVPLTYCQPYQQNGQHSLPLNLQQGNVLQFDNDFEMKKVKVYSTIANDLGLGWKEFARSLLLKEGNIDNIEKNADSFSDKIHQVFRVWENQFENNHAEFKRMFRAKLETALEKARRNDIKKIIITMLDSN